MCRKLRQHVCSIRIPSLKNLSNGRRRPKSDLQSKFPARLAVVEAMLHECDFPDAGVLDELKDGADLVGSAPRTKLSG